MGKNKQFLLKSDTSVITFSAFIQCNARRLSNGSETRSRKRDTNDGG